MPLLEMKHITKSFVGVYVNEDVDLSVEQGEIHVLLGENGAGKATLMNISFGVYQTGRGEICFKNEHVELKSPGEATARGTNMVHQHFSLVKRMMVLDNVMLGLKGQGIVADRKLAKEKLTGLAATCGPLVNSEAPVHTFSVREQRRVEILETLYRNVSLLILDEPTGVLTPQETKNFSGVLKRLRGEGHGITITIHHLGEIMDISDQVTVLRDGRKVGSLMTEETASEELSTRMIGRELKTGRETRKPVAGDTILSPKGVCLHKKRNTRMSPSHVSLTICRGEVLGIAGVEGNGQKGLARIIAGIRRIDGGQMEYQGKDIRSDSMKEWFRAGVSYISDDRHDGSLVMDMTAEDNLTSGDSGRQSFSRNMVLDYRQVEKRTREALDEYNIRISDKNGSKAPIKLMSDGDQQRVILSREVSEEAGLIVANQPIRGLDIDATRFVHKTLLRQRDTGRCALPISADLDEVLGISDRVAVMYEGRIIGILNQDEADIHKISLLVSGIAKEAVDEQETRDS